MLGLRLLDGACARPASARTAFFLALITVWLAGSSGGMIWSSETAPLAQTNVANHFMSTEQILTTANGLIDYLRSLDGPDQASGKDAAENIARTLALFATGR